ncbi:uncharacterized protein MELLADRAFT_93844 [Melampsora larici-populina 98AG31]|uniref:Uncharacterized protein n=1 Tax=Melampsora larici-populina (strain 98AG31 / pathotype 3-4-7) TaxID=747676 RepID=F4S5G2_MELLP|nr:uncharacterized protein MELLADRAFT_93844 [Melampsora larici-populina 98AG31]EGG00164.1 hypothetical protein MELLADRAFT_93844 [Melampsora larici-populina 98AG31]
MTYIAVINAIVNVTSPPVAMNSGQISFVENTASMTVVDLEGHAVPELLFTHGFGPAENTLQHHHTYSITGPFGQDSVTGRASIKHTPLNHADVTGINFPDCELAGRATITGVARVISFYLEDGPINGPDWDMVLTASHEYYDVIVQRRLTFNVLYRFGHATPLGQFWPHITAGSAIWVHGNIISKDRDTLEFAVMVSQYTLLGEIFATT